MANFIRDGDTMMYKPTKRQKDYDRSRFGLFIHWGPFSGSNGTRVSAETCVSPEDFNPVGFDPTAWAQAARQAGMRYVIFTSKHADDFCLFDSPKTGHANDSTRFGHPDYVASIADAFRKEGLRIHWYYAVTLAHIAGDLDWHKSPDKHDKDRYINEIIPAHVEQLCANYGQIDGLWFDGVNEEYAEQYKFRQVFELVRSKPNSAEAILTLNDGGNHLVLPDQDMICWEFKADNLDIDYGKYMCFERDEPSSKEGYWFHKPEGDPLKSAEDICESILKHVNLGSNYVLNIGPKADGTLGQETEQLLLDIGEWMKTHEAEVFAPREWDD